MRKGIMIVGLLVALSLLALGVSQANHACVTYDVTAPVVGRKTDTKCSPVPLPTSFNQPQQTYRCQWIPPAGVSGCVYVNYHLPPV